MDKEGLATLISALTEIEIIELYKLKNINRFGFRVNTIDDVKKNRRMLEKNLMKPINIKHVQSYFVLEASKLNYNLGELSINELKELCESEGYTKILISLYVNGKKEVLEKIISEYSKGELMDSPVLNKEDSFGIESNNEVTENKSNKKIKKLETKLKNLNEEFKKKEDNYKLQLENANKLILELRKENMLLKQNNNKVIKEIEQHKQKNKIVVNENLTLKDLNNKLSQQNENYKNEIQILIDEVSILKKEMNNKMLETTNESHIDKKAEKTEVPYKIAVIGETNDIILNSLPCSDQHVEFFEGESIKDFKIDDTIKYNEIWIIQYDLTQKEKRLVQSKNFKTHNEIEIKHIYSLKELNIAIDNLKEKIKG